jgi:hypothetical protein
MKDTLLFQWELSRPDGVIINEGQNRVDRTFGLLWNTQEGCLALLKGQVPSTKSLPDSCVWDNLP